MWCSGVQSYWSLSVLLETEVVSFQLGPEAAAGVSLATVCIKTAIKIAA